MIDSIDQAAEREAAAIAAGKEYSTCPKGHHKRSKTVPHYAIVLQNGRILEGFVVRSNGERAIFRDHEKGDFAIRDVDIVAVDRIS